MTEQEWLECTDLEWMLESLDGKVSNRKFLLFACSCCRRIWNTIEDERSRKAVQMVERHIECPVQELEFNDVFWDAQNATWQEGEIPPDLSPAERTAYFAAETAYNTIPVRPDDNARFIAEAVAYHAAQASHLRVALEQVAQIRLLRDIFGNPFRPISFDPAWRTPDVVALAQAIYDERRFADLPILADALEEAGCTNDDILSHCRDGGNHARGCWVVDLLLGKG